MDFFRKYQRVILYTAGIFALVSFSISAPILGFFDKLFSHEQAMPSLRVGDRLVSISPEDEKVAAQLMQLERFSPVIVMPPVLPADADEDRREVYAALRRLAVEYKIEVSEDEVDRAIAQGVSITPGISSVSQLVARSGRGSVAEFRKLIGEAMRIGLFVRVQALSADTSDPSLVDQILGDAELVTLDVAVLDEEKLQKEIEAQDVTDEDLQKWIDGLDAAERSRRGFTGLDQYHVQVAYLLLDAFDPAVFTEELSDKQFSDDEVENFYIFNRDRLFTVPKSGDEKKDGEEKPTEEKQDAEQEPQFRPLDDALKAEIHKRLQAAAVMRNLWDRVRARFDASVEPELVALGQARQAADAAQAARDEAAKLGELPEATQEQKEALAAAEAALTQAREAVAPAEKALDDKRAAFDAVAAFNEVAAGRAGLGVIDTGEERKTTAALEGLEPIGPWLGAASVAALSEQSPLSTEVQRSAKAEFQVRLVDALKEPLKPFAEIREKARADYFSERASKLAQERADAFEATLKRLAKEKGAEEIRAAEAERDKQVEEKLVTWREDLRSRLEKARALLASLGDGSPTRRVYVAAKTEVEKLDKELADEAAKKESILAEIQKDTDKKVEEIAKQHFGEVLAEAAAQHSFEVAEFGPYPRDLSSRGGPRERYPKPVRYLFWFGAARDLKQGESTDLIDDFSGKARYLAFAKSVQKATISDLTRRQLLEARRQDAGRRRLEATQQSFTLEALRARYEWQRPNESVTGPK